MGGFFLPHHRLTPHVSHERDAERSSAPVWVTVEQTLTVLLSLLVAPMVVASIQARLHPWPPLGMKAHVAPPPSSQVWSRSVGPKTL